MLEFQGVSVGVRCKAENLHLGSRAESNLALTSCCPLSYRFFVGNMDIYYRGMK